MTLENTSIEDIRAFFKNDRFATESLGAVISSAEPGHAICEMTLNDSHLNAMNNVMGGVIFTLADFALAVACNIGETPTVAVSNSIVFMNTAKGMHLSAECVTDKSGRTLGFYTVTVTDELGTLVAKMTATCSRRA